MIEGYVTDLAAQMGIKLSRISFMGGRSVGDSDVFILTIEAGDHLVSTLVYQSELDGLTRGPESVQLEIKIRSALERLQIQMQP